MAFIQRLLFKGLTGRLVRQGVPTFISVALAEAQYPRGAEDGPKFTPLLSGKEVQRYLEPLAAGARSSWHPALVAIYGEETANEILALSNRADAFAQFIAGQRR